MLIVGNTKLKGRGVFAQKRFLKGEVIERAPVVVIPTEQVELIDQTVLANYYYDWEDKAAASGHDIISVRRLNSKICEKNQGNFGKFQNYPEYYKPRMRIEKFCIHSSLLTPHFLSKRCSFHIVVCQ